MPQLNESITTSPEFLKFKKDNNLEVLNGEAINVVLFSLSQENKELSEMLMEVAKYTKLPDIYDITGRPTVSGWNLFDKWNNK